MTNSLLADAFGHHGWATLRLLDACADLDEAQLASGVPGTYGSILDTLRHLLDADRSYLSVCSAGRVPDMDEEALGITELRAVADENAVGWRELLESGLDPDRILVRRRGDGSATHAPLGIRLAQALHHGTDHRSQVCTALTVLGIEPPAIDAWDYGESIGVVVEERPPA